MGVDNQEEHIKTLLGCFCELLLQSDVSAYQKTANTKKNNINQFNQYYESGEEHASQVSLKGATAPLPKFIN